MARRFGIDERALVLLGCLMAAGCGDEGPSGPGSKVIVPESWRGTWRIVYTAYTCTGDSLIEVSEDVRPACPGQTLEQFLVGESQNVELQCTGAFTDSDLAARCQGDFGIGCVSGDVNASRVDSLFTGTMVLRFTLECGNDTNADCETYTIEGTRIEPFPSVCADSLAAPASLPSHQPSRLRARD